MLGVAEDLVLERLENLRAMIGRTPLLEIDYALEGQTRRLWAKCETGNLTGSIKDRMMFEILRDGYERGMLRAGDTLVEASSGNSGIACAALGSALGHPVVIYMPEWMSVERRKLLESYGARIELVSREAGGLEGCLMQAEAFAASRSDVFLPRQFENDADVEAHRLGTGAELIEQLEGLGLRADGFVAGVGTGGTVMGVSRALKSVGWQTKVHPVEPMEARGLSGHTGTGRHRIQGWTGAYVPPIVDLAVIDEPIAVHSGDAILMAQKLAKQLGLGVGISSGANFLAAIEAQMQLGAQSVVATVFADDNKKYLTTDLMESEPELDEYLAPRVTLLRVRVHGMR